MGNIFNILKKLLEELKFFIIIIIYCFLYPSNV